LPEKSYVLGSLATRVLVFSDINAQLAVTTVPADVFGADPPSLAELVAELGSVSRDFVLEADEDGERLMRDYLLCHLHGPQSLDFTLSGEALPRDEIGAMLSAAAGQRSPISGRAEAALESALEYEIPYGSSPATHSATLGDLLRDSTRAAVAPLAAAGGYSITHLANGSYIAAIQTAATAGAVTFVLIGTLAAAHLLVAKVERMRAKLSADEKPSGATRKPRAKRSASASN